MKAFPNLLALLAAAAAFTPRAARADVPGGNDYFENKVRPILVKNAIEGAGGADNDGPLP